MNALQALDSLQFNDHQPIDNEIEPLGAKRPLSVEHRDLELPLKGQALPLQLDTQGVLVDRLMETWPKGLVHAYGAANGSGHNDFEFWRKRRCRPREHFAPPRLFFVSFVMTFAAFVVAF